MRSVFRSFRLRLRGLIKRKQLERDLQDELAYHRELHRANPSPRVPFGNVTLIQEACREMWAFNRMEDLWRDVRHATRVLRRTPGHTVAIILLLATGIGANAAIFSVISATFIRDLPVSLPEQLVVLNRTSGAPLPAGAPSFTGGFSIPLFEDLRHALTSVSGLVAIGDLANPRLTFAQDANEELNDISGSIVSGNYFQVLGVPMALGRALTANDDHFDDPNSVIVLSHALWTTHLGGDPNAIGQRLFLSGRPFTIIGVTAEQFQGLGSLGGDFWVPLNLQPVVRPGGDVRRNRGSSWLRVVGRLKPQVSLQQARSEVTLLSGRITAESQVPMIQVDPGRRGFDDVRSQYGTTLQVLITAVGILLLTTCANVASLLLARLEARQREIAVRQALGCGRGRLVRQFLVESFILAGSGGLLGLAFAALGIRGLLVTAAPGAFATLNVSLDYTVLLFTIVISLVAAIVFGLAPALRAPHVNLEASLRSASRTATASRSARMLQRCFVVTQVALSVILVACAVLFGQSLYRLYSMEPGFDRKDVITATVNARALGYRNDEQYAGLAKQLVDRISSLDSVRSVSVASSGFLTGSFRTIDLFVEGRDTAVDNLRINQVSRNFLDTLGVPIVTGRSFSISDGANAPRVAIINEAFASSYFPGQTAVGRRLWTGNNPGRQIEIIGIARDAKYNNFREPVVPMAFLPLEQFPARFNHVQLKAAEGTSVKVLPLVRRAISEVDPRLEPSRVETLNQSLDRILARDILLARVSALFGAMAMLVACFGVYGIISYLVVSKTAEIGIRLALGAHRTKVIVQVISDALRMTAPGVLLGLAISLGAERFIESLLFGSTRTNRATYMLVAVGLLLVTTVAAFIPARRASWIDPMNALRCE
jgi:predicted permease